MLCLDEMFSRHGCLASTRFAFTAEERCSFYLQQMEFFLSFVLLFDRSKGERINISVVGKDVISVTTT